MFAHFAKLILELDKRKFNPLYQLNFNINIYVYFRRNVRYKMFTNG
jgi:hypothetical protein